MLNTVTVMLVSLAAAPQISSAHTEPQLFAQIAGEWTKCIARANGTQYNVVNGSTGQQRCFKLGKKCAGEDARVTYHSNPVVINAPYKRCTAR